VVDAYLKFLAFLDVCSLKFGKGVLCVVDMGRGGPLEIFSDPLSCAILRFLSGGLEPKIPDPARSTSLTLSAVSGLIMSTMSVFRKACRAWVSTTDMKNIISGCVVIAPLSTLSLISFHPTLEVFGSIRASKKLSTAFAF